MTALTLSYPVRVNPGLLCAFSADFCGSQRTSDSWTSERDALSSTAPPCVPARPYTDPGWKSSCLVTTSCNSSSTSADENHIDLVFVKITKQKPWVFPSNTVTHLACDRHTLPLINISRSLCDFLARQKHKKINSSARNCQESHIFCTYITISFDLLLFSLQINIVRQFLK